MEKGLNQESLWEDTPTPALVCYCCVALETAVEAWDQNANQELQIRGVCSPFMSYQLVHPACLPGEGGSLYRETSMYVRNHVQSLALSSGKMVDTTHSERVLYPCFKHSDSELASLILHTPVSFP